MGQARTVPNSFGTGGTENQICFGNFFQKYNQVNLILDDKNIIFRKTENLLKIYMHMLRRKRMLDLLGW